MLPNKLIIIFNNRLPTQRAHGAQIVKMCEAFGEHLKTELWTPKVKNVIKQDIYTFYNLKKNFKIRYKWAINLPSLIFTGGVIYRFRYITFLISLIFSKKNKEDIFFTRHPEVVYLLSRFGYHVYFENHNWYSTPQAVKKNIWLVKHAKGIIATSQAIADKFIENGFSSDNILVAANGVDVSIFKTHLTKKQAREKLNLPQDKKIIIYTGHLYKKKGVYTLAQATQFLDDSFLVLFVGGLPQDISKLQKFIGSNEKVKIIGYQPYSQIPLYLMAADFLVIANTAHDTSESRFTSPLKLFQYLAAAKPIIASNVPAIREIVDKDMVAFFTADDPQSLANSIVDLDNHPDRQRKLSTQAHQKSQAYAWPNRAKNILNFINTQYHS